MKTAFDLVKPFGSDRFVDVQQAIRFLLAHPTAKTATKYGVPVGAVAHPNKYLDNSTCECCGRTADDVLVGSGCYEGTMYDLADGAVVCFVCLIMFGTASQLTEAEQRRVAEYKFQYTYHQ